MSKHHNEHSGKLHHNDHEKSFKHAVDSYHSHINEVHAKNGMNCNSLAHSFSTTHGMNEVPHHLKDGELHHVEILDKKHKK